MNYDAPSASEFDLVFDAWANSFRKSPWAGCVPNHLWDTVSRTASSEIIDRGARIIVAYKELPDGTRRVAAYSVSEPDRDILHWLYVKRDYRGCGVGRELLAETIKYFPLKQKIYTYRMPASAKFLGPEWKHLPAAARAKAK
jgi:GNAT superfamily N-acetyltransferase